MIQRRNQNVYHRNGRWGGFVITQNMRDEGGSLSILVISLSSREGKKEKYSKKSEREKEKASVEIKK